MNSLPASTLNFAMLRRVVLRVTVPWMQHRRNPRQATRTGGFDFLAGSLQWGEAGIIPLPDSFAVHSPALRLSGRLRRIAVPASNRELLNRSQAGPSRCRPQSSPRTRRSFRFSTGR